MSVSYIPLKVKLILWGKAAGRCQYDGCADLLYLDETTQVLFNTAYIAHIIADTPDGPRGDAVLSPQLGSELSNLMLLCDKHHRLIDIEDVAGHSVVRLQKMKRKHEERMALLTSLTEEKQSHVLFYGANIGNHNNPLNFREAASAMLPEWYPGASNPFELSLKNSSFQDKDQFYWNVERQQLQSQFAALIKPRLADGTIKHLSIFALAPQPLLIELGRLLSDIPRAEVYQRLREPQGWKWQTDAAGFSYQINEPDKIGSPVALNVSLSGTIDNARILKVLGDDACIWTLTTENPNNDFLKSREQLSMFRQTMRSLFERIKAKHGQDTELHVFPAAPVAANIEIGRVWQPKADMSMHLYDQNSQSGGFVPAFMVDKTKTSSEILENAT